MAQIYGLAGDNQYRKYVGGKEPRAMSLPMLFLAMAIENRHATVEEVLDICRKETGAIIDLDAAGEPEPSQD